MESSVVNDSSPRPTPLGPTAASPVTLADGTVRSLAGLDRRELIALQWEQERTFAKRILHAPKGSPERAAVVRRAYDTVTAIFATVEGKGDRPLVMGLHLRYQRMLHRLLLRQRQRGLEPRFFEIGYASGVLLERVSRWGFAAAGIEVSPAMHQRARRLLGADSPVKLYLGNLLHDGLPPGEPACTLAYWNDVFEHIPPDEILDYLRKIRALLAPGGQLVTITPNWHMRPSDVTRMVCPLRTEAAGLHLKEYTLREVARLLRQAGFARVATPLAVTRRRAILCGGGLLRLKCLLEPCLELLPCRLAQLFCRALALSETIATK